MHFEERKQAKQEFEKRLALLLSEIEATLGKGTAKMILQSNFSRELKLEQAKKLGSPLAIDEKKLKSWLVEHLSPDFYLYPEVPGTHLITQKQIFADFIAYPREHLIESGFEAKPFGIEVKYVDPEVKFVKKACRLLWQTVSYNQSEFTLCRKNKTRVFKLPYSVIFTNLSFDNEFAFVSKIDHNLVSHSEAWRGMKHLANHANVAELNIRGGLTNPNLFFIHFASGTYFSWGYNNTGKRFYKVSDPKLVQKVRVGSF
ncbi:hypothetical protein MX350_004331 [Vibrio parahaemolyticus]|nr:hypothetical protein [Vibrio parahaemolyticus]EJG0936492.1 hypothetical protein [Vibrio parahaemolyticus]EJG1998112.1 hypothetical protein [Vibrio parahaemolyticus]